MRILVVTSGRADATPLGPVIHALMEYGHEIYRCHLDGMTFYHAADLASGHLSPRTNLVLILGDRFEILAAAGAATVARVPIAHIHGGEATYGSFDNQIRHAITKLSHIHFVAAEPCRERVIALGERPDRVFTVGAPGLDNITDLPPREPGRYFVATYHPATLAETSGLRYLLDALRDFEGYDTIWTGVNNDPGCEWVRGVLRNEDVRTLSTREYIELCRNAAAVVGNSSSGIIEAPTLEVPTVNVGTRQDGRLKGPSIFDCEETEMDITRAIKRALDYSGPFVNPYGGPGASAKIAEILTNTSLVGILRKEW